MTDIVFDELKDEGFNRTFMELKYGRQTIRLITIVCFNRTFMELKFTDTFLLRRSDRF